MTHIVLVIVLIYNLFHCRRGTFARTSAEVRAYLASQDGFGLAEEYHYTRRSADEFAKHRALDWKTRTGRYILRVHLIAHVKVLNVAHQPLDAYAWCLLGIIDHGFRIDELGNRVHTLPSSPIPLPDH